MDIKRLRRHTRHNTIKLLSALQFYEKILGTPENTRGVFPLDLEGTLRLKGNIVVHVTRQRIPRMSTVFITETRGYTIKIHLNKQKAVLPPDFQRNTKYSCIFFLKFGKIKPQALIARRDMDTSIHLSITSLKIEHEPGKTTRLFATT